MDWRMQKRLLREPSQATRIVIGSGNSSPRPLTITVEQCADRME